MSTNLYSPKIENWWQSKKITKVQFIELMSFIGVSYRNIGEELLNGLEMTKRQLYFQSPPSPAWITSLESYTTCRQLKRWEICQMLQNMEISWKDSSIQFFSVISCCWPRHSYSRWQLIFMRQTHQVIN